MKTVLLTSNSLRHKYIANRLSIHTELTLIITEKKSPRIIDVSNYSQEDSYFINEHFSQRQKSEERYFGDYLHFPKNSLVVDVPHGTINSKNVFDQVAKANPDFILLFGASIIKDPLLKSFEGKMINIHLGLSPYYKGSGTNLFPVYYKELSCVGATIHLVNEFVDDGAILHQIRPDLRTDDTLHDIGNKTIEKAGDVIYEVLRRFHQQEIHPVSQRITKETKICKIKDATPEVLRATYQNLESGLVEDYLKNEEEFTRNKQIVSVLS